MKKFSDYKKINEEFIINKELDVKSFSIVDVLEINDAYNYKLKIETKNGYIFYANLTENSDDIDESW